nr:AbgT family transporter [Sedimentibacter sp.]
MSSRTKNEVHKKKKREMLDGMVILFILVFIVAVLTYIIPAGEYTRTVVDGKTIVDGTSFKYIEQSPISFFNFFKAIPNGIQAASMLIIMILLIGGSIRIFDGTGAIKAAIFKLKDIIGEDKSSVILVAMILFFGALGAFPGMLEAAIPFAPLCVGISLALGYDALVGIFISLAAIVAGWSAGVTNPWTTGIGQNLAELPMFSGIGFRMIVFVVFMAITIFYVLRYAAKIKKNPESSIVNGMSIEHLVDKGLEDKPEFTTRLKFVLLTFALTIVTIVYGTLNWGWGIPEMSAVYIIGSIIGGIIAGYNANKIVNEILEGGKAIFTGAMAIGLARAISVIMDQGHITDTIVHSLASLLQGQSPTFNAIGMFILQSVLNFFIPSGSGQAVVTLPIIIPVADLIGLNRQIAILAFQFGDGLSNLCYPTVGALIAFLAYTKISYTKWIKFIMPYLIIIWVASALLLGTAVLVNLV